MIPVNSVHLGARELANVTEAVQTGWISSAGSFIEEFEESWASFCGRRSGIAVSNGTTALQVAVAALRPEPGSEIIMPSFTIISCALAAIYNECVPVLVDCDPATWCLDLDEVENKITARTFAIMPVHMYGHPADMDRVAEIADRHGLRIIEDAAQAHGAEYLIRRKEGDAWKRCGGFGDISTFSFYANKPVTTGEGGMVLTDDEEVAERVRSLHNLAFEPGRRFRHGRLGFNFRLTNVQAALGVAQVRRIEEIVERKRWIGASYAKRLEGLPGLQIATEREWARSIYWMFGVVPSEDSGLDAVELQRKLAERGVDTRPFFLGLHEQPALLERGLFRGEIYPVTERLARQGVYLPTGLGLTEGELDQVCTAVTEVMA